VAENDYLSHKKSLMRSFEHSSKWVMTPLVNRYDKELSKAIVQRACKEHETLIHQLPFIGGKKNRWTADLLESAQILALFRAMQAYGKTPSETAEVLYEGMQIRLGQYPRFLLRLIGRWQFSSLFLKTLQHQAAETHKRQYPDDFVAEVVIGDGKEFDWGIDFTECAIQKFYRVQNALEFLPYVCRLDYLTSAAFGIGLVRTKTLAKGNGRCNPRLKRGRETKWDEQSV
jgi:hypothetical protein